MQTTRNGLLLAAVTAAVLAERASSQQRVEIPDTERHVLPSAFVDEEFKVHVYLPRGYEESTEALPVVYLLDAEYSFGAVAYIVRRLIKDELIPPVVLVGVAYEVPYDDYYLRRQRDFTPNQTFNRYVIVSPSLWWDGGFAFRRETAYRGQTDALPARAFLAAGEDDGPSILRDLRRLEGVLAERQYDVLEYEVRVFPDETHRTIFPVAVSHGLRFVFR
jgi:predicted alpha/beta superfamily hydrolase